MGTSTNGQICYGIVVEDEHEFPWDEDTFQGDIDEWWLYESGWSCDGDNPFSQDGEYLPGFSSTDPRVDHWFQSQRDWEKLHPCPVTLVNYQSADYPAYIIACPATEKVARRGYPEAFDPAELAVADADRATLLSFCVKYNISGEPGWFLSSYWG